MPFFSIVVPVYNVEKYLSYCIESILSQNFSDYEIILINDGSTDNSGMICGSYAKKDARIKVIHQHNKGLGGARNTGIKHSTGEWILFVDSDDSLSENALHKWSDAIAENSQSNVLVARYQFQDEYDNVFTDESAFARKFVAGNLKTENLKETIMQYSMTSGWAVWKLAVKRELVVKNDIFFHEPIRHAEDLYWIFKLFLTTKSVDFVDIIVYNYRVNRQGALSGDTLGMMQGTLQTIHRFEEEFDLDNMKDNQKFTLAYLTNVFFYQAVRCFDLPKEKMIERQNIISKNIYIAKYIDKTISSKKQKAVVAMYKTFGVKIMDVIIKYLKR